MKSEAAFRIEASRLEASTQKDEKSKSKSNKRRRVGRGCIVGRDGAVLGWEAREGSGRIW